MSLKSLKSRKPGLKKLARFSLRFGLCALLIPAFTRAAQVATPPDLERNFTCLSLGEHLDVSNLPMLFNRNSTSLHELLETADSNGQLYNLHATPRSANLTSNNKAEFQGVPIVIPRFSISGADLDFSAFPDVAFYHPDSENSLGGSVRKASAFVTSTLGFVGIEALSRPAPSWLNIPFTYRPPQYSILACITKEKQNELSQQGIRDLASALRQLISTSASQLEDIASAQDFRALDPAEVTAAQLLLAREWPKLSRDQKMAVMGTAAAALISYQAASRLLQHPGAAAALRSSIQRMSTLNFARTVVPPRLAMRFASLVAIATTASLSVLAAPLDAAVVSSSVPQGMNTLSWYFTDEGTETLINYDQRNFEYFVNDPRSGSPILQAYILELAQSLHLI